MIIESVNNPYIKEINKLNMKKYRDQSRKFIVEGDHLVSEALKYGYLQEVITTNEDYRNETIKVTYVTNEVLKKITNTITPQDIIGVCSYLENKLIDYKKVLVLDRIQDPGNLGTIIRSADAFGVDLVVLGDGTCDLYNEKVVRSTQGSLFHLPIVKENIPSFLSTFNGKKYGTSLQNGVSLKEIELSDQWAFIVGNEGSGVSEEILSMCDQNIYIDMPGKSESLNVGIATSIILYEFTK